MTFDATRARELLELHRPYHSELQIDHFITARAGLTTWGMFVQALRELNSRLEGMKSLASERKLADIERRRHERTVRDVSADDLDREEAGVRVEQAVMRIDSIDRNVRDTWRELERFYAQAVALRARLPVDLTPQVRDELERDRWVTLLTRTAALDIATSGRLSLGTLDSIWSLPVEERSKVLEVVRGDVGVVVNALDARASDVPEPPLEIAPVDPERILELCG